MKKILLTLLLIFSASLSFSSELNMEIKGYYEKEEFIKIIEILETEVNLTPDLTFYLAESYLYSIKGPASWMKYNNKYQDTIVKCLASDPDNIIYQLNSARGMMWLPSSRGSRKDGVEIILDLEKNNPDHPEVIYAVSNYRYGEGLIEEAKEGYLKLLKINPDYKEANEILDIIAIDESNLSIRNISFIGSTKTSIKRLSKKISEYKGISLNRDSRAEISSKLSEISSIKGININAERVDDFYVDLEIEISEVDTKILMFQQVSGLGLDYDSDIFPSGLMPPVTIYIDNNLFGTGSNLMLISVFVYNQLSLTVPGLIDDKYLDFKLDATSMLLPTENSSIIDGKIIDSTKKIGSNHSIKAGLGRTFPFNLSAFLFYQAIFDLHEQLNNNIKPNHTVTHSISSEVIFNTAGAANTPFDLLEGYSLIFIPSVNYIQNYKPWGNPDSLITHNNKPSITLNTTLGYYKNLTPKSNLSLTGTWMINHNPYDTDVFALGHRGDAITAQSVTGYLPGEIVFNNGILLNTKYTFTPLANKINLYGKYDLVLDIENRDFYNGIALGGAVKLPWDLDLKTELGLGLNAKRDSGPGYFISLELTKLMIF